MWNAVARVAAIALALLLAGCASVDRVVKIGLVAPFEGRHRAVGYDAIYSARLAVRQINAAGGVGGHRVALVALDDRGDAALATQAAASLAIDPAIVAVVGHFLPEVTADAATIYESAGIPLLPLGQTPFIEADPATLPTAFLAEYEAVTPFDEVAGPFAGPTADAFALLRQALALSEESTGDITRESVQDALRGIEYEGMTGTVYLP